MRRGAVILCFALIAVLPIVSADPTPEQKARIDELIKQLGDMDATVRKEATRKLEEIGPAAIPALEGAMKSDDPEVRMRAKEIYEKLAHPTPEQLQELRNAVQDAFSKGDYDAMISPARRLLAADSVETADRMWLGHAYQLSGRWKEAVAAYLDVIKAMDAELKTGPKPSVMSPAEEEILVGGFNDDIEVIRRPVHPRALPADPNWRGNLMRQRASLALWVARIQRLEVKDPKGAIQTLNDALAVSLTAMGQAQMVGFLKELALAQEDAGDVRAALETWERIHQACLKGPDGHPITGVFDMQVVERLLTRLDGDGEAPKLSFVYLLSPSGPDAHLLPNDPETRAHSYFPSGNPDAPHWKYAFAPPPGKEFDKLEFACDIEQLQARHGGQLSCSVSVPDAGPMMLDLGGIGWPNEKPIGRDIRRGTFDIPPGVRMVHVTTGTWKGAFIVHDIVVKATFRPATKDAPSLAPRVGAWMQTEFLPVGGKGTCGDMELVSERAYSGISPRKGKLRYEVPGRADSFEADFTIEPGRRYGIFVNLDSPFKWTQAGPRGMGPYPTPGLGLVPLPGGGYLAAWSDWRQRVMLSITKDLVTWTDAEPAPFNSVFVNIAPAVCAAKDGTIWMAYFSARTNLLGEQNPGFSLWLTGTRDGKTWTAPRPIKLDEPIGTPSTPPQLLQGPDGKCWIFFRSRGASASSFAEIRELSPITPPTSPEGIQATDYVVAADARGFRMVYVMSGGGLGYATSKDGANWSSSESLVQPSKDYSLGRPQLILAGDSMLLLYEYNVGGCLVPLRPGAEPVVPGTGLRITNHVVPLYGSRPFITKDGEVLLLAGADTSWLLRTKLKDLASLCKEEDKE